VRAMTTRVRTARLDKFAGCVINPVFPRRKMVVQFQIWDAPHPLPQDSSVFFRREPSVGDSEKLFLWPPANVVFEHGKKGNFGGHPASISKLECCRQDLSNSAPNRSVTTTRIRSGGFRVFFRPQCITKDRTGQRLAESSRGHRHR